MKNFHSQLVSRHKLLAASALALSTFVGIANAQPVMNQMPAANMAKGVPGVPMPQPPAEPSMPNPMPTTPSPMGSMPPRQSAGAAPMAQTGVPFQSMQPGQQKQTDLPLSNEPLSLDQKRVDATEKRMIEQSDRRLGAITGGKLESPDTSAYSDELREMAELQRKQRLLDARQALADKAIKYWQTVHDSKREDEASKMANVQPVAQSTATLPSSAPSQSSEMLPYAKVVSIEGAPGKLRATLLVPYVGEVNATVGTILPGNRKVSSISSAGVSVSDPVQGIVPLGFGDTVAMVPPMSAASPTMRPLPAPIQPVR